MSGSISANAKKAAPNHVEDKSMPSNKRWYLYIIENRLQQLYTGITTDPERRFNQHQQGKGAKALRGKGPLTLRFSQKIESHSQALKLEKWLKAQPRSIKLAIIEGRQLLPY